MLRRDCHRRSVILRHVTYAEPLSGTHNELSSTCHSERSEESSATFAVWQRREHPVDSSLALRMTIQGRLRRFQASLKSAADEIGADLKCTVSSITNLYALRTNLYPTPAFVFHFMPFFLRCCLRPALVALSAAFGLAAESNPTRLAP